MKPFATVLGVLLGLLLAFIVQAAALETAVVEEQVLPEVFVVDATIEAVKRATLAAETTGRIKAIYFDVDDVVAQGEVLLHFTDKEQRARLARAEAAKEEIEVRLREAEAEHGRVTAVYARKLVAKSALDKAVANLKAARQRLKATEADVRQAREQLAYTVVRAPYAGIVVKRHVNTGERVRPGTPLMTGFSLDKLRATASVPQSVVEAVRRHGRVIITLAGKPPVLSEDITVYPYADAVSHGFTVRAQLSSLPAGVYPGMFAKAAFVVGEQPYRLVPARAVVHRSEVTAVYVVDEQGRVGFRAVRLGRSPKDGRLVVLAGLEIGEQVALDPVRAGVRLKEQRAVVSR
jgi:RND family efflux transporter MFP subunit